MLQISLSQKIHKVKWKMMKIGNYPQDFKYLGIEKNKNLPDIYTYIEMLTENVTKISKPLSKNEVIEIKEIKTARYIGS